MTSMEKSILKAYCEMEKCLLLGFCYIFTMFSIMSQTAFIFLPNQILFSALKSNKYT